MQSAYDRMLMSGPEILGGVEIVGNPALGVSKEGAGDAVRYKVAEYLAADEIHMGIGGVIVVPAATAGFILQAQVSTPFKPQRVSIRSTVAPWLMIEQVTIGPTRLIDGNPISGENWSEVSLNQQIEWPTAETSQLIIFQLANLDPVNAHRPGITLKGWRLRK